MQAIDITHNPWHFRFLKFMDKDDSILYNENLQNTCGYVRTFLWSVFLLTFFSMFWFWLAFDVTFNVIVASIFIYHLGFSMESMRAAANSMPDVLSFLFAINFAVFAVMLLIMVVMSIFTCVMWLREDKGIRPFHAIREKLEATPTYEIVHAWHNKICRPIKLSNDDEGEA